MNAVLVEDINAQDALEERISEQLLARGRLKEADLGRARRLREESGGSLVQLMTRIAHRLGDRVVHIGGLPTAEVFAQPYLEMGVATYSSAVFNFVPELALRFYRAVRQRDTRTIESLMKSFYLPLIELRDRKRGYAISMIKAGAELVGRSAGKVRAPLTELDGSERKALAALIEAHS